MDNLGLDPLFMDSAILSIKKGFASPGMLQRHFKIGFNRAITIINQLTDIGLLSTSIENKPQRTIMSLEDFCNFAENTLTTSKKASENIATIKNTEILKNILGVLPDYTHDGMFLNKLQNIVVPQAKNNSSILFLNNLLKYNSEKTLKLILFDKTGLIFLEYRNLPHLYIPIISDASKLNSLFDWLYNEMEARIKIFLKVYARDISIYNQKTNHILPSIVIIINEAYDLHLESLPYVNDLLLNSNRMGIYLIIFSKLSNNFLHLGSGKELLKMYTEDQLLHVSSDNTYSININQDFDCMNGYEFETYCVKLLAHNSFQNIELTKKTEDQGIDIIAFKDGIKYGIQCKCYSSDIGNKAIQEAFSGKTFYHCHVAAVMTNRYFTPAAKKIAISTNILLWDRDFLQSLISK